MTAALAVAAVSWAAEMPPGNQFNHGTTTACSAPADQAGLARGQELFLMNCAHCHGTDARGDEGPDLHGLRKSDAALTKIITNGIKGEMPRFGQKLQVDDVKCLIRFLRSLKPGQDPG